MRRPKSTIPNSRMMRIGAISENSTIACDRWGSSRQCLNRSAISVTAHRHMRVRDDVDRVAEDARQHAGGKAEAHDQDHVHVRAPVAGIYGRGGQVETG